jgi:ferredoxin-NADP reductase
LLSPNKTDDLRRGADLRGRIVSVRPETADAATIVIRPGADWAGHVPGQYLRIGVDIDGVRQWRAYSLTHGPRPDRHITITVKALPGGLVSNHLVRHAAPGQLIHLEQAAGDFVLGDQRKLLFVTAGSGITPVMGMLRNLSASGALDGAPEARRYDIVVVHLNVAEDTSIFRSELLAGHQRGEYSLIERFDEQHGLFEVADLAGLVPDLAERATYACGPGGLLDALQTHHDAAGLPLFTEQFRTARVDPGEGGSVRFTQHDLTVLADGATPILEAAEAAGVLMPSGCRMGICFGCVLPLREGSVRDLRTGEITTAVAGETGTEGLVVQTCINAAAGPCQIDH